MGIFSIVSGLIIFYVVVIRWFKEQYYFSLIEHLMLSILLSILFIFLSIFPVMVISSLAVNTLPTTYEIIEEKEILSFKNHSSVEGSFFLGTGRVSEDLKYYYLVDKGQGYSIENVSNSRVSEIRYGDTPKIIRKRKKFDRPTHEFLFGGMQLSKYVIYIPEGSIHYNFEIDKFK